MGMANTVIMEMANNAFMDMANTAIMGMANTAIIGMGNTAHPQKRRKKINSDENHFENIVALLE